MAGSKARRWIRLATSGRQGMNVFQNGATRRPPDRTKKLETTCCLVHRQAMTPNTLMFPVLSSCASLGSQRVGRWTPVLLVLPCSGAAHSFCAPGVAVCTEFSVSSNDAFSMLPLSAFIGKQGLSARLTRLNQTPPETGCMMAGGDKNTPRRLDVCRVQLPGGSAQPKPAALRHRTLWADRTSGAARAASREYARLPTTTVVQRGSGSPSTCRQDSRTC